jgi:hypothetical protein
MEVAMLPRVTPEQRTWVRGEYAAIKARLRDEYKRTQRDEALLNAAEAAFYAPFVHEAYCRLEPLSNAMNMRAIGDALDSAYIDLEFALAGLSSD